jgi:hypothetical protein
MQQPDEHIDERTYAAQAAEQDFSIHASPAARPQHVASSDTQPTDQNSQIYSYVTLVAERFQKVRADQMNEVNNPHAEAA